MAWKSVLDMLLLPSFANLSLNNDRKTSMPTGTRGPQTRKAKRDEEELEELASSAQEELELYADESMAPEHMRDPDDVDVEDLVDLGNMADEDLIDLAPTPEPNMDLAHARDVVHSEAFVADVRRWMSAHLRTRYELTPATIDAIRFSKHKRARALARKYHLTEQHAFLGIERVTRVNSAWQQRFGRRVEKAARAKRVEQKARARAANPRPVVPTAERFDNSFVKIVRGMAESVAKIGHEERSKDALYARWNKLTEGFTDRAFVGEDQAYVDAYKAVVQVVEQSEEASAMGKARSRAKSDEEKRAALLLSTEEGIAFLKRVMARTRSRPSGRRRNAFQN